MALRMESENERSHSARQPLLRESQIKKEAVAAFSDAAISGDFSIGQKVSNLLRCIPDLECCLRGVKVLGNKMAVSTTWKGTQRDYAFKIPPSEKPFTLHAVIYLEVIEDKVTRRWADVDLTALKSKRSDYTTSVPFLSAISYLGL